MKVLLTGASGFLGWHTRARLRAFTDHDVVPVDRAAWSDLARLAKGADAIIHCAGVNRGVPDQVEQGNIDLASALANAAVQSGSCPRIVFADSIQAGNDTPYGRGKGAAAEILAAAADECGGSYRGVRLPNLFGENGRPNYNSFVATFVDAVANGFEVEVQDRHVTLLHAQDAAQTLVDRLVGEADHIDPHGTVVAVQTVLDTLRRLQKTYLRGNIPSMTSDFEVDLFNALRAAAFPGSYPIELPAHSDERGRLIETVRSHGGQGQTFISSTRTSATRGQHFHVRKIERFVVVAGQARISLRRLFGSQVISFDVRGDDPVAIDMPTMWAHNIKNTGSDELVTMFWTNELFDPDAPDTYPEPVEITTVS